MSEVVIILVMLVPVVVVVMILNNSKKKQKKKAADKLSSYLRAVTTSENIDPHYQKDLVHQVVGIDGRAGKLLVVNHENDDLSHELYPLNKIKSIRVVNHKHTIQTDDNSKKPEVITTQIGLEINTEKPDKELFLKVYDHIQHNIFQMSELEKKAHRLQDTITKAKNNQLIA